MLNLIFALSFVFQDPSPPAKGWIPLTNLPGWEGYVESVLPSGWVEPVRFRRVGSSVEVPPARPGEPTVAPAAPPGSRVLSVAGGDPFSFIGWLNAQRAARGLPPVGHDPNLSAWAARNSAMGLGHLVRMGRRQNSGIAGDAITVGTMWMTSPAHASAMLDSTITRVGIAVVNGVWTMNAD